MKQMKLFLLIGSLFTISFIQAISIAEYIQSNGQPRIVNGTLNLSEKNLTSLEGIDRLSNPELIKTIDLSINPLHQDASNYENEKNYKETARNAQALHKLAPFSKFRQLEVLDLGSTGYKPNPYSFQGLIHLKKLDLDGNQLNNQNYFSNFLIHTLHLEQLILSNNALTRLPNIESTPLLNKIVVLSNRVNEKQNNELKKSFREYVAKRKKSGKNSLSLDTSIDLN